MALAQRGHGAASHLRPLTPIADVERLPHHGIKFLEGRAWWPATAGDRVGTKPTDAALPSPRPGPRREDAAPGDRWHRRRVGQELPAQQLVRWHHAVLRPSGGHHFAAPRLQPQGQQQPFRPSFPPLRQHLLQHPPHLLRASCYVSTTTTSAQPRSPDSTSGHSLSACSRCPTTRNNHPFRERPEKLNLSGRSNVLVCIQGQARQMHEGVLPVK